MKNKKLVLILLCSLLFIAGQAQVSKTINVSTPGTLSSLLTANELITVTDLTVTGSIDARDFKTMRESMTKLLNLNLEQTNIMPFTGTGGSSWNNTSVSYPANEIPESAFSVKTTLKSIVMPAGTVSIGQNAFGNCSGLTGNLKLPSGLERIRHEAFYGCLALTGSLVIPANVKYIEYSAFQECTGFKGNLIFQGEVLDTIDGRAFEKCSGFTGPLTLPANLKFVGGFTFESCTGFNGALTLPSSLTNIGFGAFSTCTNMKGSIIIPSGTTLIEARVFEYCSGLDGQLSIPSTVKSIDWSAFTGCSSLKGDLHIPSSVTSIGIGAFSNCSSLDGTLILPDSITIIDLGTFSNCSHLSGTLNIPPKVWKIADNAFTGCAGFTGSLNLPPSVARIGTHAFEGCSGFNGNLNLGSVNEIDAYAFKDCSGFTGSLNLSLIYNIEEYSFYGCKGFNGNLTFRKIVEYIGDYAFNGCSGFTGSLNIPDFAQSGYSIGINAFSGCSGFNGELKLSSSITTIRDYAFYGCTGFTGSLILPKNEYKYFDIAYGNWYNIGNYAFSGCKGFNGKLVLPNQDNTRLGSYAFADCTGLVDSLTIPLGVTAIGDYTFSNCSGLNGSLTIPSIVTSIGNGSFMNCTGLNGTVSIPATVTNIGTNAFMNCSNLKKFNTYVNNPSNITLGTTVFAGIPKVSCNLFVPVTKKPLYAVAAQWKDFINISEGIPATVTTGTINSIYTANPTGNGNITNIDPNDPTQYGVIWSTTPYPTIDLITKTSQGPATATGSFTYSLSGLTANTSYYVRTYVSNSTGTNYGEQITIKTPNPAISSPSVSSLNGFKTSKGTASSVQTFTIGGTELVADIVVTAPSGFEVRQSGFSYFASAITITKSAGSISTRTIEVRISSSLTTGVVSGNVVCSSAWATDQLVAVSGEITQKQLTITNPTITTNKMVDGNPNAVITKLGTLQGYDAGDAGNVGVTATATYNNANAGINKTITVVYTLTGSAKDKYLAPANYVISNAKISDYITLSPLSITTPGCEGNAMDLPFNLLTGTPTQYKITFNAAALSAGMKNVAYLDLSNANTGGTLTFSVPNNTKDGTYQGVLKMRNELNVESVDYPFAFTINVSADYIRTKFNDVVLFDNSDKRFVGFQWCINGIEIPGATKQFYCSPMGFMGNYSVKLTSSEGNTLYTCSKGLIVLPSKAQISAFPNPVKVNEDCRIQVAGLTNDQLKDAKMSVYDTQGTCVYESSLGGIENKINLPVSGAYIGHVTAMGIDYVFKLIVLK